MTKPFKVLVVDNSRLFQAMLNDLVIRNGLECICCKTAAEALGVMKEHKIDMVCAAYHLPDSDATSFVSQLRALPTGKYLRICLFTSEDNADLLKQALQAGATDIYDKKHFTQFVVYVQRLSQNLKQALIGQVLLVDDSQAQRMWMKAALENRGLEIDAFSQAEDALVAYKEQHYELVISDIVLSGAMTGFTLVREIRRLDSEKSQTPILAVSGYDDFSRRMELYHMGINDYLAKPVIEEELIYRVANLIQTGRLIFELKEERKNLEKIALLDPVTGLYNRNAFEQFGPKELATSERSNKPFSVAVLDLDYFKRVNDEYGHDRGDQVLAEVGQWLRTTLRKGDFVFRWGGEEFVLFLANCTSEQAYEVMEKQRLRFVMQKFANLAITASIGVSGTENFHSSLTIEQLFKQADRAVYEAKGAGRNRVCLFQP